MVQPGRVTATVCVKRLPGPKSFPAAHGRASHPPPAPTHSSTETLGALFLFLLTFNTTDTAETQNAYVTVGAGSVHLHRHVMSELTSSQTPRFLVSLSCVMSATRSACQLTAKERTE